MKKHHKTQKLSRIKVAALKSRMKKIRIKKHPTSLAAKLHKETVINCTIPKPSGKVIEKKVKWGTIAAVEGIAEWKIPKEGYPQVKMLRKKYKKKYWCKDGSVRKIVTHPSDWSTLQNGGKHQPVKMTRDRYNELMIAHKTAKWLRKHPRPVKQDDKEPDLFEQEFMGPWREMYNKAVEHIREVVLSKRDKLPLTGRFQKSDTEFTEEKVAEIKDTENEGDKINHLDPKKSPLLKKAQKKTNQVKAKRSNLVCTNLRDRKNQKGRIILPRAA